MSVLEMIVIAAVAVAFVYILYVIYSPKKKKKEKKPKEKKVKEKKTKKEKKTGNAKKDEKNVVSKSVGEKKVEQAIKKEGSEKVEEKSKTAEQEEEKELVLQKEPPKEKGTPFKIIRKQSKVKINKQALKSGSRNPSVTKVFDKGKRVDIDENSNGGLVEDAGKEIAKVVNEVNTEKESVMSDIPSQDIGHYGIREPRFDSISDEHEFRMRPPFGSPNRAPVIGDRTNFGSHLRVTDDNNLSGVMGTGVAKIIEQTEAQSNEIDKKTDQMVRNVKRDILGDIPRFGGMFDISERGVNNDLNKETPNQKLKNLDAETIMIAQAIAKRKGAKKN